jgi:hypothetical protein
LSERDLAAEMQANRNSGSAESGAAATVLLRLDGPRQVAEERKPTPTMPCYTVLPNVMTEELVTKGLYGLD